MEFRSRKCTAVDKICGQNFAVKLQAIADKTAKTVFGGYLFATTGTCMHVSSWHFVITLSNRSWSAIFFCCWGANKISKQRHMVKVVRITVMLLMCFVVCFSADFRSALRGFDLRNSAEHGEDITASSAGSTSGQVGALYCMLHF